MIFQDIGNGKKFTNILRGNKVPVKFKETVRNRDGSVQNYYMRSTPTVDLKEAYENMHTPPKKKQKILSELVKRGHA